MSEGEKTFMVLWIPKTRDNGVWGGGNEDRHGHPEGGGESREGRHPTPT